MAKEIRVIAWCDGNHDEDDRVQADNSVTLAFGRGKPRTVDLCDPCNKELIHPVMELFGTYGVVGDGSIETGLGVKPKSKGGLMRHAPAPPCPECGHQAPTRSALGQHLKNQHGTGIKDYPEIRLIKPPASI